MQPDEEHGVDEDRIVITSTADDEAMDDVPYTKSVRRRRKFHHNAERKSGRFRNLQFSGHIMGLENREKRQSIF